MFIEVHREAKVVHSTTDILSMTGTMIELKCAGCETSFLKRAADVKSRQAKGQRLFYCGYSCAGRYRKLAVRDCAQCGNVFQPVNTSAKFCSVSCELLATGTPDRKRCTACKNLVLRSEFSRSVKNRDGLGSWCRACAKVKAVEYRKNNPSKPRAKDQNFAYNLKRNYGITPDEYRTMHEGQGGLCAVCFLPERSIDPQTGLAKKLAVHHNHVTGKVIALCCAECNMGMGKLKDDPVLLMRAAKLNEE